MALLNEPSPDQITSSKYMTYMSPSLSKTPHEASVLSNTISEPSKTPTKEPTNTDGHSLEELVHSSEELTEVVVDEVTDVNKSKVRKTHRRYRGTDKKICLLVLVR
uniref:Uncharacterized protein n=1 Tax=Eucampia antarctica TaxID=49252 RepID=A0A7S2RAD6_9STRA|mmetsp:Transcript_19470/g.18693  ORF Transcript_19470/g.18693 Transcript_19470/m.18693 type:complete len:106 (+) Transcript_19470:97-414(+)